jgi:hypothetical protein
MTAENDPGNTNSLNPESQEGVIFCYALIKGKIEKGAVFVMNTAPFCVFE